MNLTDDLTNGIIWKQLTALALPLIWGNILQQMYNTIDSFVVGIISEKPPLQPRALQAVS